MESNSECPKKTVIIDQHILDTLTAQTKDGVYEPLGIRKYASLVCLNRRDIELDATNGRT